MKRSVIAIGVFTLVLFAAACATTTAPATTPSLQGTITAVAPHTLTVKAASGETSTVNVGNAVLSWFTGADAIPADFRVGYKVNVWLKEGTQDATKIVITQ